MLHYMSITVTITKQPMLPSLPILLPILQHCCCYYCYNSQRQLHASLKRTFTTSLDFSRSNVRLQSQLSSSSRKSRCHWQGFAFTRTFSTTTTTLGVRSRIKAAGVPLASNNNNNIVANLSTITDTVDIIIGGNNLDSVNSKDKNNKKKSTKTKNKANDEAYRELEQISTAIRYYDNLYYNSVNDNNSVNNNNVNNNNNNTINVQNQSTAESLLSSSTTATTALQPIDDEEYDALVRREAELCQSFPAVWKKYKKQSGLGDQATRYQGRVGIGVAVEDDTTNNTSASRFVKRKHLKPMLSLDNADSTAAVLSWLERVRKSLLKYTLEKLVDNTTVFDLTILTEPKIDGLSLSCRYEHISSLDKEGLAQNTSELKSLMTNSSDSNTLDLTSAATRGDGRTGQDVTRAVVSGQIVPLKIKYDNNMHDNNNELRNDARNNKNTSFIVEIRGEVVLPQSAFATLRLNKNATLLSNARNAASGILLRQENTEQDQELRKMLKFYAYDLVTSEINATRKGLVENDDLQSLLQKLGFNTPQPTTITKLHLSNENKSWSEDDIRPMLDYHRKLQEHRENKVSKSNTADLQWDDYEMDGCVHKVVGQDLRNWLGASSRVPRWAIAHKFAPKAAVTELLDVLVQVGRTGTINPVAVLNPVEIDGVKVKRATLHNYDHMHQVLQSSTRIRKGTPVLVRRAGEVIPQIVQRVGLIENEDDVDTLQDESDNSTTNNSTDVKDDDEYISLVRPVHCPSCGSVAVRDDNDTTMVAGPIWRCGGPPLQCSPRAIGLLVHAFSRDALYLQGLSEARLAQLFANETVKNPADIFVLAKNVQGQQSLEKLDGWGSKSVRNLVNEANRIARDGVSLARFIYSLGIRHVGIQSSAILAATYRTAKAFLNDVQAATANEVNSTKAFAILREKTDQNNKGIGPVLLSSLYTFASDIQQVEAAVALSKHVLVLDDTSLADQSNNNTNHSQDNNTTSKTNLPFANMAVVFTGKIGKFSRQDAQTIAKTLGAKSTPNTISKNTNLLVAGDNSGSKITKATDLGVKVMTADEFCEIVAKHDDDDKVLNNSKD